jgi:uncharacterized delta-60 repeat protein
MPSVIGVQFIARTSLATLVSCLAVAVQSGAAFGSDAELPRIDRGEAVAIQPDGKVVVAGSSDGDFALARYEPDGSLDQGFGNEGRVLTDLGGAERAQAVAIQPDGAIVVAGDTLVETGDYPRNQDFAIARYVRDGSLDPSFSGNGVQVTDIDTYDQANAVDLQDDGGIVVAGNSSGPDPYDEDFALARYRPDGSLDPGFGAAGVALTDFGRGDRAWAVRLQPDGKIVAAGDSSNPRLSDFALARYGAAGALDPSFGGGDGKLTTEFDPPGGCCENAYAEAHGLALQPDAKIVVAGYANGKFALARYGADGAPDPGFGTGGKLTHDVGALSFAAGVALQSDGKIVAAGTRYPAPGDSGDFVVARYDGSDGDPDPSFSGDGVEITDFGADDRGAALALDSAGRAVVAGTTGDAGDPNEEDFAVARYQGHGQGDGTLDDTFAGDGTVITGFFGTATLPGSDPPEAPGTDGETNTVPPDTQAPRTRIRAIKVEEAAGKHAARAEVQFTASDDSPASELRFRCKLDHRKLRDCRSPLILRRLRVGEHVVRVVAIDGAGNADPSPARKRFSVAEGR